MTGLKAILVSVEYADLLAITLPYNRHHFDDVMVVTAPKDEATLAVAVANHCQTHVTNSFHANGAAFNKWAALEEALDRFNRGDKGWLCIMDADVAWPRKLVVSGNAEQCLLMDCSALSNKPKRVSTLLPGCLYGPLRRMSPMCAAVPPEEEWARLPIHRNIGEWAGYSQIFHTNDRHLGAPPWHQTDWTHAGGADSFFQAKWPDDCKRRLPFEVLHIGEAGVNWCGRATPMIDGTLVEGAEGRRKMVADLIAARVRSGRKHVDKFAAERVPKGDVPERPSV